VARLRHALSDWRTYIVLAYLALALVSLSLYRSVRESREADRAVIVANASRHLANCHEVEGVKTGIRLFLREVEELNRELDGEEAELRAQLYEQFIRRYFDVASCPREER